MTGPMNDFAAGRERRPVGLARHSTFRPLPSTGSRGYAKLFAKHGLWFIDEWARTGRRGA
jgi:hypothetical protein